MRFYRIFAVFLILLAILPSCGAGKTIPVVTEPETSAPTVTPTAGTPSTAPESPTPVHRERYHGVLYELRESYSDYVMPTLEDYVLGGFMERRTGSEEEFLFSLCGKEYEMHLYDYLVLLDAQGVELRRYNSYSTGGRYSLLMNSTAVYNENGLPISATLTDTFLPEEFTEEDVRASARRIVEDLTDFDPDSMTCTLCTVEREDNGNMIIDGYIEPDSEENAFRFSYEVSFYVEVGGLKGGRYIDIRFCPYNRPLHYVSISIGWDNLSAYKDTVGAIDQTALFNSISESLDGILDRGNATGHSLRDDTLRFRIVDGKPSATVDAVVTIDYEYPYEATLCFVFDNDGAELKTREVNK